MADLDRIMGRELEEVAFLVWNGSIVITVDPSEFPKMKTIIEKHGEDDLSDNSDGSFSVQIAWFAEGDDTFDHSLTVDQFEQFITKYNNDELDTDEAWAALFAQFEE